MTKSWTSRRILIVGPGAMGCGLAALLERRGARVQLLDHRAERALEIRARGVRAEQDAETWTSYVLCVPSPLYCDPADLVIILVKAYDTGRAVAHARPCIQPTTAVLTLQNGLGNYETILSLIPTQQVLAGTIVMGCTLLGTGHVRISGVGEMVIGSPSGHTALAEAVVAWLRAFWPEVRHEPDIDSALWRKAIINAAINPLTALTGLHNGELLRHAGLREALSAIAREANAVAAALGIHAFAEEDPAWAVARVCELTAGNRSSMLQDVTAGRRTEVEQICGEIARRGQMAGVPAPLCATLTAIITALGGRSREA